MAIFFIILNFNDYCLLQAYLLHLGGKVALYTLHHLIDAHRYGLLCTLVLGNEYLHTVLTVIKKQLLVPVVVDLDYKRAIAAVKINLALLLSIPTAVKAPTIMPAINLAQHSLSPQPVRRERIQLYALSCVFMRFFSIPIWGLWR